MSKTDGMSYGIIKHGDPEAIPAIQKTLLDGYTPEQIGEQLKEEFPHLLPSQIENYVGAARFIQSCME